MRLQIGLSLLLLAGSSSSLMATQWYVSPTASTSGNGTISNPWKLQTALNQPAGVLPGDTIWLRGGTYYGTYISKLVGTQANPIIVRGYPGEWPILDKNAAGLFPTTLEIDGSWTWYWGFELTNSEPTRVITTTGSNPLNGRAQAITVLYGTNIKMINLFVHDSGDGVADNNGTNGNETYGSVIYHNGWLAPDRGHGQNIYAQNSGPNPKTFADNIVFSGFNQGFQMYGSANAKLYNFILDGNITFNSGMLEGYFERNILVGGQGQTCLSPIITNNYSYYSTYPAYGPGAPLNVGYTGGCSNAVVNNNYLYATTTFSNDTNLSLTGNTFAGNVIMTNDTPSTALSTYSGNTQIPWGTRPTGLKVYIRPNKYEPNRAHVAIFNWVGQATVNIDPSSFLATGTQYEIRDGQNPLGTPIASGTYNGGTIPIPMTSTTIVAPVGTVPNPYFHTTSEFGAFIILPPGILPNSTPSNTVVMPQISPSAGNFNAPVNVTMSTSTPNATIRYTTDGSTPTTSSTQYTGAFVVSSTATVKAIATASGMTQSAVASSTFTIRTTPAVISNGSPFGTLAGGTTSVTLSVSTDENATCGWATPDTTYGSMTRFATTGGTAHSTVLTGLVSQAYNYYVRCLDTFGNTNGTSYVISFTIAPSAGTVAAPVISPNGGVANAAFNVSLSSATSGASIYYTTNGTAPSTSSSLYSAPFSVGTAVVNAIAVKTGMTNSSVSSASFVMDTTPPVLSSGAPSGTLASSTTSTSLTLSTNENATCRYSTSDIVYGSMTAFATTGGLSHSTPISGLTPGSSLLYFVRCSDLLGNANTASLQISFSIATPPIIPGNAPWYQSAWGKRKAILINHALVAGALSNFPVLISITDPDLQANAQASGGDILFTDQGGVTKLNHEVESYTSATGALTAWVNVPNLSNTTDTVLYMYFGNAGAANQGNPNGVWDANFKAVWHLNQNPGSTSVITDSTANHNNGAPSNMTAASQTAGVAGPSLAFNGTNQFINVPDSPAIALGTAVTVSSWIKTTSTNFNANVVSKNLNCIDSGYALWLNENGKKPGMPGFWVGASGWIDATGLSLNDGAWHHLATTNDGTNTSVYLDGALKASGPKQGALNSGMPLRIAYGSCGNYLAGTLDETRVSGSARSTAWIATEFANSSNPAGFEAFGLLQSANQPVAATPVISPNGGSSNTSFNVTLTTSTSGAAIYYTTNGTTPTTGSTLYSGPFQVISTSTVKAIAAGAGLTQSSVASATFTIRSTAAVLSNGAPAGALPAGTTSATLSLSTDEAATCAASTSDGAYNTMTALSVTGGLTHSKPLTGLANGQSYTYYVRCLDTFGNTNTSSYVISFSVAQPSGVAATPSISPNGGVANAAFTVTLASATSGASIYYTTNGTAPSTSSTLYSAPFSVGTAVVNAIAVKTGMNNSAVATASFTVDSTAPVLSNGAPAGTLAVGTTSATLSVTTNENATCGYSTTNVAYGSMTVFSTTGALSHSTPISGLTNGLSYTYFVRCSDAVGNANTSSLQISFAVASPPIIVGSDPWYQSTWAYRKGVVINHAQVAGPLSNFPVLISVTDSDMQAHAQVSGADILFTAADGITKLNHEVESYDSTTGTLNAWVNVPSLSNAADTLLYLYFGNASAASQANPAGVWDSNFKGVWHLNQNPGATSVIADSTGNHNNGAPFYMTAASQSAGVAGGGLSFNGTNQFVNVPDSPALALGTAVTVSAWIRTTAPTLNANILAKDTSCINSGYAMWLNENGKKAGMPGFWVGSNGWIDASTSAVNDGVWHHLAATNDGTTTSVYVDGALKATGLKTAPLNTTMPLRIAFGGCGNYFAGSMDETRLSGSARPAAWIATEFANESAPQTFATLGVLEVF